MENLATIPSMQSTPRCSIDLASKIPGPAIHSAPSGSAQVRNVKARRLILMW